VEDHVGRILLECLPRETIDGPVQHTDAVRVEWSAMPQARGAHAGCSQLAHEWCSDEATAAQYERVGESPVGEVWGERNGYWATLKC
jgi:hypothetical protein